MGIFVLTGILVILVVTALLFIRGGAREPVTEYSTPGQGVGRTEERGRVPRSSPEERARQLLRSLGFEITSREASDGHGPGFVAVTETRRGREQVYMRVFDLPAGERVREPDVISALDFAHAEGLNQAFLVSPNGFTDEAMLAARDSIAELIDDVRLDRMLRDLPAT